MQLLNVNPQRDDKMLATVATSDRITCKLDLTCWDESGHVGVTSYMFIDWPT